MPDYIKRDTRPNDTTLQKKIVGEKDPKKIDSTIMNSSSGSESTSTNIESSHSDSSSLDISLEITELQDVKCSLKDRHCCWGLEGRKLRVLITFICVVGFSLLDMIRDL
ncbi:hypothetical protein HII12_003807 [Brettanomyces bruxellensis]|uniref:Uncharacterized protein n=1 Tax=Dekkera bruxellensis TaxID=5007 RepID=A0A8H6BDD1_DEKBR|nr:hypothetical protein HII12_003807 [Brettanomyces bruxellensis]